MYFDSTVELRYTSSLYSVWLQNNKRDNIAQEWLTNILKDYPFTNFSSLFTTNDDNDFSSDVLQKKKKKKCRIFCFLLYLQLLFW